MFEKEKPFSSEDELSLLWKDLFQNPQDNELKNKVAELFAEEVTEKMSKKDYPSQDFAETLRDLMFQKGFAYHLPESWKEVFSLIEKYYKRRKRRRQIKKRRSYITPATKRGAELQELREMRRAGFDEEEYNKFVGNDYP